MNRFSLRWIIVLAVFGAVVFSSGCEEDCIDLPDVTLGTQYFTLEYRTPGGQNYVTDIYNPANLQVTVDYTGGERLNGGFDERFRPGTNGDGKFGPFFYTERYIDSVTNLPFLTVYNRLITHDYFIRKDTFGIDTLRVQFWLETDNCNTNWRSIRYFLNGEELTDYSQNENAEIVIEE